MKALFISNDNASDDKLTDANTSYFRILIPKTYLEQAGHTIDFQATPPRYNGNYPADLLDWTVEWPETVLVERMLDPNRVRKMRLNGARRIVLTFDDNYRLMPKYSRANEFWKRALPGWLEALPLVDEVVVPSLKLVSDFRSLCKKITYLPNFHDPRLFETEGHKYDRPTIGWGGSEQHLQSWTGAGLIPALKSALADHPHWQLVIFSGMVSEFLDNAGVRHVRRPWVDFQQWPGEVKGFDIGLAPLHGDYDDRRSFLKCLEYGLAGVPFIASDAEPYRGKVQGGFLVGRREREWREALECLMMDSVERRARATEGLFWASQYTMDKNIAAYERVLWPS